MNHPTLAGTKLDRYYHGCALFHDRDEEYRVLGSFYREGLDGGEKELHIVNPAWETEHLRRLEGLGIDTKAHIGRGQLDVANCYEVYLQRGVFGKGEMLTAIDAVLAAGKEAGFPRTRIMGNMGWAFENPPGSEQLIEFEAQVNEALQRTRQPAICVYDIRQLSGTIMMDILRAHPLTLVGGTVHIESLVPLEFAYVAARAGPRDAAPLQLLRCRGTAADPGASPWQERLKACGADETTPGTGTIPIDGNRVLRFLRLPLGYYAEHGVLVTGAARDGFPTANDGAVLRAAAALAATGLHTARVMEEREAAVRLKDEFLAMLGHELRNPLSAITAATAVLGRTDLASAMGTHAYHVLCRQTTQLTRLLDDLLDVSHATMADQPRS